MVRNYDRLLPLIERSRQPPEYLMDLTEDQISRFMEEKYNSNILYAEYDVTKFVRLGLSAELF